MKLPYTKLFQAILFCLPLCSGGQVVINEYSASNRNIQADNDGDYEDFIELYNTTAAVVDLSGWHLTDDYTALQKWTFPAGITIASNGFLRIWASSKDKVVGAHIHTNFKITQTKNDVIALCNPSGAIVDSVSLQLTQKNHSRGRTTNGGSSWGVFTSPSPNASNGVSYAAYVDRPSADLPAGFYTAPVTVTLSCPDPTATIYYTTDGSKPSITSAVYTGPITFSVTTVLRARAFSSNLTLLGSFEEVNTYFINVVHDERYYILSLSDGKYDDLFNSWGTFDIDSYFELFDKDRIQQSEGEGKVDPHGNDSWAFPQKGVDFEMEDDYGYAHDIPYKIFEERDRPSFDHLILKAGASDNYPFSWGTAPCHMRDAYAHTLAHRQKMDVDVRTWEPAVVYINGEYWGLYEIREKTDEPDFTSYYYEQGEEDIDVLAFWGGLNIKYGSDADWNSLYSYMQANSMSVQANYDYVEERLNLTSMIDYMVSNTYMVNCDWINWNTMWWRGRDPGGLRTKWTYSYWDEDNILGLGQNYSGWPNTNYTADPCDLNPVFNNAGAAMGHLDMLDWLLVNPDFKNLYINRFGDLMNTALSCDTMLDLFYEFKDLLSAEMPNQVSRWGGSVAGWESNLAYLEDWITQRCVEVTQGIIDCYGVTGPYNVTVLVEPPGAGTVKLSTITPGYYPWTGSYFGEVDLDFSAKPYPGNNMQFTTWEISNNVVNPSLTDDSITINLVASDTVIAHFENILPAFAVTVDVEPAGSGTVTIEGTTPPFYPYAASYLSGSEIDMMANPEPGYIFDYWELENHYMNPNSTDPQGYFSLFMLESVLAHFREVTGVEDVAISSVKVYPTLTSDLVTVSYDLKTQTDLALRLYGISGQLVRDLVSEDPALQQGGTHEVRLSMQEGGLEPGAYLLNLTYPGYSGTFKIILLPH